MASVPEKRALPVRPRPRGGRIFGAFVFGLVVVAAGLLAVAWFVVRH